jgi:hypothetical protein
MDFLKIKIKNPSESFNPFKRGGKGGSKVGPSNLFPFGKPTPKQRWKAVFKKTQMTPRGILLHLSIVLSNI